MEFKCPKCGSTNVANERRMDGDSHCLACRFKWKPLPAPTTEVWTKGGTLVVTRNGVPSTKSYGYERWDYGYFSTKYSAETLTSVGWANITNSEDGRSAVENLQKQIDEDNRRGSGTTLKRSPMPLRLGKKPPRHDSRTLKLSNYLNPTHLPPLPNSAAWSPAVLAAGGYPIFLNDQLGCCAIAGPAHMIQTWTANAGLVATITDADILSAYSAVSGYDPDLTDANGNNPTDTGCNLLDVLNYCRKVGIAGHKIGGYVKINHCSVREMQYAVALFGGALLGVALPDSVVDGDLVANRWDDGVHDAPNPENGHCIVSSGFDAGWDVETWGTVKAMSYNFGARFIDESYAVFSPDWLNAGGKCPAGLDAAALLADLEAITRA